MNIDTLIGALQLTFGFFQFNIDSLKKKKKKKNVVISELKEYNTLGIALESLEFAVAETLKEIDPNNKNKRNSYLAELWQNVHVDLKKLEDCSELQQLTFLKNLYWENPEYFESDSKIIQQISLKNFINEIKKLRNIYNKL